MAFRPTDSVGTRNQVYFAAQWLAYTLPCRRFADTLAGACARLGADADRYSFIAVDLHHLLFAGLPAHLLKNSISADDGKISAVMGREARFEVGDHKEDLMSRCGTSGCVYKREWDVIFDCVYIRRKFASLRFRSFSTK
jgi:hypothetical protein